LIQFGFWLKQKGLKESTIKRKIKFLKHVNLENLEKAKQEILEKPWIVKTKKSQPWRPLRLFCLMSKGVFPLF